MKFICAALALVIAANAYAADKPVIGPPPSWVKPVSLPDSATKQGQTAVRVLLADQQINLEAGRQTVYSEMALKIQTPQGLEVGNVTFAWRPETDVLTVHKLRILRGGQTIDVLASGQTFTVVRRETNLERATLDGVLTANIQPEGLQVGDILDFAVSISSSDPVLNGHVEQILNGWNGAPIDHAHLRIQWPSGLAIKMQKTAGLPDLKPVKTGTMLSAEIALDDLQPIIPPKGAPNRYRLGRMFELTDYGSWADVGALMAPLYQKAAIISAESPLRNEVERIKKLSGDPKVRAEAALALVQDRTRYVALAMGAGGLVPADAETTWSRRYGDCKGKTALLLALLHEFGIQAEPVAANIAFGDGLDARLPMVGWFNHVLVRATIAGRSYWLDGTRSGDTSLDRLRIPDFDWGLPLVAKSAALVRMVPPPLESPDSTTNVRIDARAGLTVPAPTTAETILRGDAAIAMNLALTNLASDARESALREYWRDRYNYIDIRSANTTFDAKTGELRLAMEGTAQMDWSTGWYEIDGTAVGYRADFSRDPGPDRDAPFAVSYPYATKVTETILLPKGFENAPVDTTANVDQTVAGIEYHRHANLANNVFTIEKSERSIIPEFPAKDAPAAQTALRTLADHAVYIRKPPQYKASDEEVKTSLASTPTTANEYIARATMLAAVGRLDDAIKDLDQAVVLEPKNPQALASRGLVHIYRRESDAAAKDLEAAQAIDPKNAMVIATHGLMAEQKGSWREAFDDYSKALEIDPNNYMILAQRAHVNDALGRDSEALKDAAAALGQNPKLAQVRSLRAKILAQQGRTDEAIAEAHMVVEADPQSAEAHIAAANIYRAFNKQAEAMGEFDQAIALDPRNPSALASRAFAFAVTGDAKAATQDLNAAEAIDPKNPAINAARGLIALQKGSPQEAIAGLSRALELDPNNASLLASRAQAEYSLGHDAEALADSAAVLKQNPKATGAYLLRANILRREGKQEEAIAEARALTAANPEEVEAHVAAANIYSAFHKDAEAMAEFDRAIAIRPEGYVYLNRAIHRPKDDISGRQADLDAALKLEPTLKEAIAEKAKMLADGGDSTGAIALLTSSLAKSPNDAGLLMKRGMLYAKQGDAAHADADFAAAHGQRNDPGLFNNICWSKAIAGIALESALRDCNAALEKAPDNPMFLDSRALVLLRLGRIDDAIADYDKALAKRPDYSSSLFGRALAWARKGDKGKAQADAAAAAKINPNVKSEFEGYGLKLQ